MLLKIHLRWQTFSELSSASTAAKNCARAAQVACKRGFSPPRVLARDLRGQSAAIFTSAYFVLDMKEITSWKEHIA